MPCPDPKLMTRKEIDTHHREQLQRLITHAGSMTDLARMLDLAFGVVASWHYRGRISRDGAERVDAHPTLSKYFKSHELRLDGRQKI